MLAIELAWLGGAEGSFAQQSPRRRAQLVAHWRIEHGQVAPIDTAEHLGAGDFMERMRSHYGGKDG